MNLFNAVQLFIRLILYVCEQIESMYRLQNYYVSWLHRISVEVGCILQKPTRVNMQ